jgi:hypothetical protein
MMPAVLIITMIKIYPGVGAPSAACGTTPGALGSNDPTPDLGDTSPYGDEIYIALRGPFPLTVSHAAVGSCPGLGLIRRDPTTGDWSLAHVLPTTVMDYTQLKNLSDPHAVIIRRNTQIPVPAPMPLLGLAMALNGARRLRRRLRLRPTATQASTSPSSCPACR